MSLLAFVKWCDATAIGVAIRNSTWAFPAVESFHLLALAVLGGTILIVDLRLCGLGLRRQSTRELARDVQPWLLGALAVMLISGAVLFTSEALKCYENLAFQVKIVMLAFALLFTFTVRQRVVMSPGGGSPLGNRLVGGTSMALWSAVGLAGRGIGFW
jgi:hypothetical protein